VAADLASSCTGPPSEMGVNGNLRLMARARSTGAQRGLPTGPRSDKAQGSALGPRGLSFLTAGNSRDAAGLNLLQA